MRACAASTACLPSGVLLMADFTALCTACMRSSKALVSQGLILMTGCTALCNSARPACMAQAGTGFWQGGMRLLRIWHDALGQPGKGNRNASSSGPEWSIFFQMSLVSAAFVCMCVYVCVFARGFVCVHVRAHVSKRGKVLASPGRWITTMYPYLRRFRQARPRARGLGA